MPKHKHSNAHHDDHMDETWLIPYSDLLTLLLALFIVLFASAQIDQKKFTELARSFSDAFKGNTSIFDNQRTSPQLTENRPTNAADSPAIISNKRSDQINHETSQLSAVKSYVDQYAKTNGLAGSLETSLVNDGLMIRIRDNALFPSGTADLLPQSRTLATEIANILAGLSQRVVIAGYTDNIPINTHDFPSNWDLSSKRALTFMKFILAQDQRLTPARFSAVGYSEYHPIAPNDTEAGRAKNRRVEVLIVRNYQQQGKSLITPSP